MKFGKHGGLLQSAYATPRIVKTCYLSPARRRFLAVREGRFDQLLAERRSESVGELAHGKVDPVEAGRKVGKASGSN